MMNKSRHILHTILFYSIFAFYVIMSLAILFRASHLTRNVNLIPFRTINSFLSRNIFHFFVFSNLFGNILLFVPLGIYNMIFIQEKSKKKAILWVFLTSLTVEIVQYTFKKGVGDIDDIILNVLGGYIGAVLYQKWLVKLENEKKINFLIGAIAFMVAIITLLAMIFYYH